MEGFLVYVVQFSSFILSFVRHLSFFLLIYRLLNSYKSWGLHPVLREFIQMEKLLIIILHFSLLISAISGSNVPSIYVFGDSLFDAGNNHYNKNCTAQADFPPYGSTFFHHPTGRFTNGRTVADFICECSLISRSTHTQTHIEDR